MLLQVVFGEFRVELLTDRFTPLICFSSLTLFSSICSSIFSTIIDQAPFAIEDLMKELKAAGSDSDSDLGQSSEEDDEEQGNGETKSKPLNRKGTGKQMNGMSAQKNTQYL